MKNGVNLHTTSKRWATPAETADYLAVSKRTIYRLAADGHLVAMNVRGSLRIRVDSVFKYEHKQIQLYALEHY